MVKLHGQSHPCNTVIKLLIVTFLDTQEAPKSLGIETGGINSSSESLNEDNRSESQNNNSSTGSGGSQTHDTTASAHSQQSISSVSAVKSNLDVLTSSSQTTLSLHRPPLPVRRAPLLSTGGAFISYVRRRGEPDGGRNDTIDLPTSPLIRNIDTSQANTTDSDLSDGYTSQQTLNKVKIGYSSLRGPVKVSRPGGGGESDAAFTPSPPVTIQNVDNNVSMALAHQTRIRNLYSGNNSICGGAGNGNFLSDNPLIDMNNLLTQSGVNHRPGSSSSASSTTDWEGSGHATVLRRAAASHVNLPPLPPSRQTMPLVDSLRPLAPLAPVYNNLTATTAMIGPNNDIKKGRGGLESTSSDSDFERSLELPSFNINSIRVRNSKLKHQQHQHQQQNVLGRKISDQILIDRLSVRTEIPSSSSGHHQLQQLAPQQQKLQQLQPLVPRNQQLSKIITDDDVTEVINSGYNSNLYFSPNDSEVNQLMMKVDTTHQNGHGPVGGQIVGSHGGGVATGQLGASGSIVKAHNKNIQDSILRHMNREMTPTISEVYHERNLGLGLAPPLSKLLLSKNYENDDTISEQHQTQQQLNESTFNDIDLNTSTVVPMKISACKECDRCCNNGDVSNIVCEECLSNQKSTLSGGSVTSGTSSKVQAAILNLNKNNLSVKKSTAKPWLCNVQTNILKASDLTTADILERQNKFKLPSPATTTSSQSTSTTIINQNDLASSLQTSSLKRVGVGGGGQSPFSELSRRDEGDGRSVADSQCSSFNHLKGLN